MMIEDLHSGINYIGTTKISNPKIGDLVSDIRREEFFIYDGNEWIDCGITTTGPTIEYREIKPKVCVRCGAPLHGYKCEYCDTEYS